MFTCITWRSAIDDSRSRLILHCIKILQCIENTPNDSYPVRNTSARSITCFDTDSCYCILRTINVQINGDSDIIPIYFHRYINFIVFIK